MKADIDESDVNGAESLQEKISKGIRDIFKGRKKKKESRKMNEEKRIERCSGRRSQEEMIKIFLQNRKDLTNVPELESRSMQKPSRQSDFDDLEKAIEETEKKEEIRKKYAVEDFDETDEEKDETVPEKRISNFRNLRYRNP